MLILSRAPGERIMVGDNVVLTVIKVEKGRVHIGIDAPREVPVHREEIYKRNKSHNREQHGNVEQTESTGHKPTITLRGKRQILRSNSLTARR